MLLIQVITANGFTFTNPDANFCSIKGISVYLRLIKSPVLWIFAFPKSVTNLRSAATFAVVPMPIAEADPSKRSNDVV